MHHIQATVCAFAAVLGNGSVVTLGFYWVWWRRQQCPAAVQRILAAWKAFAAILDSLSVVTWGDPDAGGDASI